MFESIVVFENYPGRGPSATDSELTVSDLGGFERTNYPLTLIARPGGAVPLEIAYDGGRFSPAFIERMGRHLTNLLEAIAGDPSRPLSEIEVLSEPERRHLVVELNAGESVGVDRCVHELFEAQASATPDAVALVASDGELTYAELNRRANRLAHHLIGRGVGAKVPVGICLERAADLVVGLLAVLKAGGAYLPLDPDYPAERLKLMVEDTGAPVVVTSSWLEADRDSISACPDTNPNRDVSSDDVAYVIYTSGSTGVPKGVAVAHGSLAEHCAAMAEHYSLTSSDRVLVFGSFNFDVSLEQTLAPLIRGAGVVVRAA